MRQIDRLSKSPASLPVRAVRRFASSTKACGAFAGRRSCRRRVAAANGFAFFDIDPLYGRRHLEARFSAITLLTSDEPCGPCISLDGVHPSAAGHRILAREAAKALNVTFHLAVPRGEGLLGDR